MIKFGTDGWRGIISDSFTFANVRLASQGLSDYINQNADLPGKIAVGYDRRFLSREFAGEASLVFAGNGIEVLLGETYLPTPSLSWSAKNYRGGLGGAVVITASHNPPAYNGFKFKEMLGCSSFPETTVEIEQAIERFRKTKRSPKKIGTLEEGLNTGSIKYFNPIGEYSGSLEKFVDPAALRALKGKILIDPMNGAGSGHLAGMIKAYGITPLEIHSNEDPLFRGLNPEPIEKNLLETLEICRKEKVLVGLVLDGDADRLAAIDERGEFFNTQELYSLFTWYFLGRLGRKGSVAKTVSTTHTIDRLASKYGVEVKTTPIGFKHIARMMVDGEVFLGGEESGGIGFAEHLPERDALFFSLLLLNIISKEGMGVRALYNLLIKETGPACFVRQDFKINENKRDYINDTIGKNPPSTVGGKRVEEFSNLDGFKFIFKDSSWLLIRTSGTEAVLRLYAEAESRDKSLELIEKARKLLGI